MTVYLVSYNMPDCLALLIEHDDFDSAKNEVIGHIETHIEALENEDLIRHYKNLLNDVRDNWKEGDVPLSVRVHAYIVGIQKSDNI